MTGRPLLVAFVVAGFFCAAAPLASELAPPSVSVRLHDGAYEIAAEFDVNRSLATVRSVLTDYEHIPRFLPQVERSVVLERTGEGAVVEQEAVTQLMMFSKRMHLILDIREAPDALVFTDTCGRSFVRYEGSWRLREEAGRTFVQYRLLAQPRFDAPDWLIGRVMKRDASRTIERIQAEIGKR
jgi:ribosome-associated toxin RatA of RatAB toxin-antitoxin module